MKLDLPTPGVPVSPTRSAGRAGAGSAASSACARRAVVGAGRFDQRDRPRQRPPVAGGEPRRQRHRPLRSVTQASSSRFRFGPWPPPASLAYPAPPVPTLLAARPAADAPARRSVLLALGLALAAAPPAGAARARRRSTSASPASSSACCPRLRAVRQHLHGHQPDRDRRHRRHLRRLLLRRPVVGPDRRQRRHRGAEALHRHLQVAAARCATAGSTGRTGTPVNVSVEPPREQRARSGRAGRHARPGLGRLPAVSRRAAGGRSATPPSTVFDGSRLSRLKLAPPVDGDERPHLRRHLHPGRGRGAQPWPSSPSFRSAWCSAAPPTGWRSSSGSRRRPASAGR